MILNPLAWVHELTAERPPLVGEKIVTTFADRVCDVVSVADHYGLFWVFYTVAAAISSM
jgi:hypothetical protein